MVNFKGAQMNVKKIKYHAGNKCPYKEEFVTCNHGLCEICDTYKLWKEKKK